MSNEDHTPYVLFVTIKILTFPVVLFFLIANWMKRVWRQAKFKTKKKPTNENNIAQRIRDKLAEKRIQMARIIPMIESTMYGELARAQIKEARKEVYALEKKIKQLERSKRSDRTKYSSKSERKKKVDPQKLRARTEEILRTVSNYMETNRCH
jgi:hypothetical protein